MKVTVKQNILAQVLAHANRIVEKRLATPVLGCVLFETIDNEHIKVTSTNLDMTVVDVTPCSADSKGSYCLPANLLYDITKKLNLNSEILLEKADDTNTIVVNSNKASFSLHYIESGEFPPIAKQDNLLSFELKASILKNALNIVKVSMSQDNARIQLNGVYMHYENEDGFHKIRVVATDLFRIACVSIPVSNEAKDMPPVIVSRRAVGELLHLLDDVDEADFVIVTIQNGQIMFETSLKNGVQSTYSTRLISGAFPEYKMALNVNNDKVMIVETASIVDALDRVSTVISDTSNSVKLSMAGSYLTLSGVSREFGSATENLEIDFKSDEQLDICFNSRYLLELLKQVNTDKVSISFNSSSSPTVIKPVIEKEDENKSGVDESTFVIMPVELIHN